METNPKRYPNRLGVVGWGMGGRWGMERYLYTIHRITGLGLAAYFLLHILVTTARAFGQESWEKWMGFLHHPVFKIAEFLVFAAFAVHGLNGIRLVLVELGYAVGRPEEPVYPYSSSLHVQRPLMFVMMGAAAILIALGGYDLFSFSH